VNALRAGLVRYDRRHGWRGGFASIDVHGNWKDTLKAVEIQSGIDSWRVAGVLSRSTAVRTNTVNAMQLADEDLGHSAFRELALQEVRRRLVGRLLTSRPARADR